MRMERPIETEGKIVAVLPGTMFRVALANDHLVLAHISGKMRKRFIRLTTGDLVKLEISPYDLNKARIVYRLWTLEVSFVNQWYITEEIALLATDRATGFGCPPGRAVARDERE